MSMAIRIVEEGEPIGPCPECEQVRDFYPRASICRRHQTALIQTGWRRRGRGHRQVEVELASGKILNFERLTPDETREIRETTQRLRQRIAYDAAAAGLTV